MQCINKLYLYNFWIDANVLPHHVIQRQAMELIMTHIAGKDKLI